MIIFYHFFFSFQVFFKKKKIKKIEQTVVSSNKDFFKLCVIDVYFLEEWLFFIICLLNDYFLSFVCFFSSFFFFGSFICDKIAGLSLNGLGWARKVKDWWSGYKKIVTLQMFLFTSNRRLIAIAAFSPTITIGFPANASLHHKVSSRVQVSLEGKETWWNQRLPVELINCHLDVMLYSPSCLQFFMLMVYEITS